MKCCATFSQASLAASLADNSTFLASLTNDPAPLADAPASLTGDPKPRNKDSPVGKDDVTEMPPADIEGDSSTDDPASLTDDPESLPDDPEATDDDDTSASPPSNVE